MSPEEAGFSKNGGFLTIYSRTQKERVPEQQIPVSTGTKEYLVNGDYMDEGRFVEDPDNPGQWLVTVGGYFAGGGRK
jgi:hypothetical protein